MENKIILETERLFLREMNMDDYDALFRVLADPEIMQHYPYSFDEERVKAWIERNMKRYQDNGFGLWAVCLKETGEMIGDCGLSAKAMQKKLQVQSAIGLLQTRTTLHFIHTANILMSALIRLQNQSECISRRNILIPITRSLMCL